MFRLTMTTRSLKARLNTAAIARGCGSGSLCLCIRGATGPPEGLRAPHADRATADCTTLATVSAVICHVPASEFCSHRASGTWQNRPGSCLVFDIMRPWWSVSWSGHPYSLCVLPRYLSARQPDDFMRRHEYGDHSFLRQVTARKNGPFGLL